MTHEVLIPPKVVAEIGAIGDYIAQENPRAARRVIDSLYRRCLALDLFPERGRAYGGSYRAVNDGRYVIIYRVEPARVIVVAVMHGSRDIRRILGIPDEG